MDLRGQHSGTSSNEQFIQCNSGPPDYTVDPNATGTIAISADGSALTLTESGAQAGEVCVAGVSIANNTDSAIMLNNVNIDGTNYQEGIPGLASAAVPASFEPGAIAGVEPYVVVNSCGSNQTFTLTLN